MREEAQAHLLVDWKFLHCAVGLVSLVMPPAPCRNLDLLFWCQFQVVRQMKGSSISGAFTFRLSDFCPRTVAIQ